MQLTPEQIQLLFEFTEKKMVRYYDLQIELVDHLATRIEEKMSEDSSLTFETALQDIYKDFGLFGFANIVQEKSSQISEQYDKRFWKEVTNLFRWPEILTIVMFALSLLTLTLYTNRDVLEIIYFVFLFTSIILQMVIRRRFKPKKKLLAIESLPISAGGFFLVYYFLFRSKLINLNLNDYFFAVFIFIALVYTLAGIRIHYQMRRETKKTYPEAFA